MLTAFTVILILVVGYAYLNEGLFTAAVMCCNVFIAGLLTFNFYEPVAGFLDDLLGGSFIGEYTDFLAMLGIFALLLAGLRMAANSLAPTAIEYHGYVQSAGGVIFGMLTGFLVAGFLVCALQTLLMHENFLGFDSKYN